MVKLSFIVPVYNVEPYLRKCVDSLLAQDYSDYEIILVDDGSPDNCPQICDEYTTTHKNIQVIHQKNGGLSAARNTGLKAAKGEYVCFVDSDDYWESNVLGGLMVQIERDNLDVLRLKHQNVNQKFEVFNPYKRDHSSNNVYSGDVTDGVEFLNERFGIQCYAVMFIIRREIVPLFTHGIHFEDVDWLPRMMLRAERVNSTDTVVYYYLIHDGSITQEAGNIEKRERNVLDAIYVIEQYNQLVKAYVNCLWLISMRSSLVISVLNTVSECLYEKRKEYLKRLYALSVFPLRCDVRNNTLIRKVRLCNISPRLYLLIMHLKR